MRTQTLIAASLASLTALSACSYRTMDACESATGTVCHMTLDGYYARGPGIPIDSPAAAALIGAAFAPPPPIQPYYLPIPQAPARTGFTCSTLGSNLLHTINCY